MAVRIERSGFREATETAAGRTNNAEHSASSLAAPAALASAAQKPQAPQGIGERETERSESAGTFLEFQNRAVPHL